MLIFTKNKFEKPLKQEEILDTREPRTENQSWEAQTCGTINNVKPALIRVLQSR
jgi:hypothetical protein